MDHTRKVTVIPMWPETGLERGRVAFDAILIPKGTLTCVIPFSMLFSMEWPAFLDVALFQTRFPMQSRSCKSRDVVGRGSIGLVLK